MPRNKKLSGLIWITGFSSSGKTTVSRKVNFLLKKNGNKTVFLDGDDLRVIFGNTWGYDRESRVVASQVYFRLCSHLVSQGYVVVISAIAMFDKVAEWIKTNVSNSVQVFLNVPPEVRLERDANTKRIYQTKDPKDHLYDLPKESDLIIDNYGSETPGGAATKILEFFESRVAHDIPAADKGRNKHWDQYYKSGQAPDTPSPFAISVQEQLEGELEILEMGCGNGRDSKFFASKGHSVSAFDRSTEAIEYCKRTYNGHGINFSKGTIFQLDSIGRNKYDVIYSRFVLHSMPQEEEVDVLIKSFDLLKNDGLMFIECRSIDDQLARKGSILSHSEKVEGHYRRFIILDELLDDLNFVGFKIIDSLESKGLAVDAKEDPMVIRIQAVKP